MRSMAVEGARGLEGRAMIVSALVGVVLGRRAVSSDFAVVSILAEGFAA
jgi:hypothetical protein